MGAQAAIQVGPVFTFGEQRAAIAVSTERLGREEAGGGGVGLGADHGAVQRRAKALRKVVQQEQIVLAGDGHQGGPIGGLSKQIDPDDGAGLQLPGRTDVFDPFCQVCRVDLKGARIDIDEDRGCTQQKRHLSGGGVGEGGQKHRIATADVLGHHRDLQCVGAGTDADTVLRAAEFGQFILQFADLGAEDKLAMFEHPVQPAAQIDGNAGLLGLQIEERDGA